MKQFLLGAAAAVGLGVVAAGGVLWSGSIDFAADAPHSLPVTQLIEWAREQAIAKRASGIVPPTDLSSADRIRRGAGNYEAMCVSCHLSPGMDDSELRQGLYPSPPKLTQANVGNDIPDADARRFQIIKHGIKGSGMPAWAHGGMDDEDIWDLTAFLKVLPTLSASDYQAHVASSDGHSHGGVEMEPASPKPAQAHDHKGHAHSRGQHRH